MNNIFYILVAKIDAAANNIPTLSAEVTIANVMNVVYFIAAVAAVITIIVVGFMMTVQGNNPEKIKLRKNAITFSVVGLVIVIMAFVITQFIVGRFG